MSQNFSFEFNKDVVNTSTSDWNMQFEYDVDVIKAHHPVIDLIDTIKIRLSLSQNQTSYIELTTIINELYNNAVDHGLAALSSDIKHEPDGVYKYYQLRKEKLDALTTGSVKFDLDYNAEQNLLTIEIEDTGTGFDFEKYSSKSFVLHSLAGRGLYIVNALADQVEYFSNGSKIRVYYTLKNKTENKSICCDVLENRR